MIAMELDMKDDDLMRIAVRLLRVKGIQNLQTDYIDVKECRILGFPDIDEAEKAMEILKGYRIPSHLVEM